MSSPGRSGRRVQERVEGLADHGAWCHAVSDGAVVELGVAASLSHVCRPCSTMDGVSRHTPSAWAMGASMSKICGWLGGLRGMPVKFSSAPSPGLHMCPCRGGKGAEEGRVQPRGKHVKIRKAFARPQVRPEGERPLDQSRSPDPGHQRPHPASCCGICTGEQPLTASAASGGRGGVSVRAPHNRDPDDALIGTTENNTSLGTVSAGEVFLIVSKTTALVTTTGVTVS